MFCEWKCPCVCTWRSPHPSFITRSSPLNSRPVQRFSHSVSKRFWGDHGGRLRRGLAGGNSVVSLTQLWIYWNRKAEWNADRQGKTFLEQTAYRRAISSERPGFGASLSLTEYAWRQKVVSWCAHNILLEAPALGKSHLNGGDSNVYVELLSECPCSLLPSYPVPRSWLSVFPFSHSFHSCPWGLCWSRGFCWHLSEERKNIILMHAMDQ